MADQAWMFLAFGSDATYLGNEGYEDSVYKYSYDDTVNNCWKVKEGDLAVIAGRESRSGPPVIVGLARIATIRHGPGTKPARYCPECREVHFWPRQRDPKYRCKNGHEFAEPIVEMVAVEAFVAEFGGTYREVRGAMSPTNLRHAQRSWGDINSIRAMNPDALSTYLSWDAEVQNVVNPAGYPDPEAAARVDAAAMPLAVRIAQERYPGLLVKHEQHNNPGYDLAVLDGAELVRRIEVKSTTREDGRFYMSAFQRDYSETHAASYSLLVLAGLDIGSATCDPRWFDGRVEDHVKAGCNPVPRPRSARS